MDAGTLGADVFLAPNATVIGEVTLGDRVGIWFGAVVRADRDRIAIGADSNVQDNCVVHTTPGRPVKIGREVSIGHGAILHGCTVGDRVLIGMGAVVLNDAVIGDDSLIGAGAVVTEKARIPPGSVVVGVPGKVVKQTTEAHRAHIRQNAASYVELARRYR
jgi:carbonic anhydrase/acetyltransferase-like protein (isoleucine patch superfamily)